MSSKKKILLLILFLLVVVIIIFIVKSKNKNIVFASTEKNSNVDQLYIFDDLKVYDDYNSKKVIGSVESDSWIELVDYKIDENNIWYKIKSKNNHGFIKGVDNYVKHVDEYIAIENKKTVINIFYDIKDNISEIENSFKDSGYKIKKFNIYFKENYSLYYKLSKEKELSNTPCVVVNDSVFDNYFSIYDETVMEELSKDGNKNYLFELTYVPDKKTCIKDRKAYLNEDDYKKLKQQYEDQINELKSGIEKSEELIEQTGGFLSDEMFKKIADMTEDEGSLETLKQRYVLIDTYKRYKELLKDQEKALETLNNYHDGIEEVSLYVFKCD